jgi:hypothetical protein
MRLKEQNMHHKRSIKAKLSRRRPSVRRSLQKSKGRPLKNSQRNTQRNTRRKSQRNTRRKSRRNTQRNTRRKSRRNIFMDGGTMEGPIDRVQQHFLEGGSGGEDAKANAEMKDILVKFLEQWERLDEWMEKNNKFREEGEEQEWYKAWAHIKLAKKTLTENRIYKGQALIVPIIPNRTNQGIKEPWIFADVARTQGYREAEEELKRRFSDTASSSTSSTDSPLGSGTGADDSPRADESPSPRRTWPTSPQSESSDSDDESGTRTVAAKVTAESKQSPSPPKPQADRTPQRIQAVRSSRRLLTPFLRGRQATYGLPPSPPPSPPGDPTRPQTRSPKRRAKVEAGRAQDEVLELGGINVDVGSVTHPGSAPAKLSAQAAVETASERSARDANGKKAQARLVERRATAGARELDVQVSPRGSASDTETDPGSASDDTESVRGDIDRVPATIKARFSDDLFHLPSHSTASQSPELRKASEVVQS